MRVVLLLAFAGCGTRMPERCKILELCVDAHFRYDAGPPCNPEAQTGCNAGLKCTWITDTVMPPSGHLDCVMDGSVAIGAACISGPAGPTTGFDNCFSKLNSGGYCWNAVCELICDPTLPEACPAPQVCKFHAGILIAPSGTQYGTCE